MRRQPSCRSGQLITDILSGKVDFSVATAATVLPHIEAGRLRALAVPIVDRVNAALNEALRDPDIASDLAEHGLEPAPSTPEELTGFIRAETAKWRPIIERAGASAN